VHVQSTHTHHTCVLCSDIFWLDYPSLSRGFLRMMYSPKI